jgi:NTE family protein
LEDSVARQLLASATSRLYLASASLPALLPPVLADGHVLVDGGLFDNTPVGPMQDRRPGATIAVEVALDSELDAEPGLTQCPPAWRILLGQLSLRRRLRVPPQSSILTQSILCGSLESTKQALTRADLVLAPIDAEYGVFDFHRHAEMVEAAYRSTMERAEELVAIRDRVCGGSKS